MSLKSIVKSSPQLTWLAWLVYREVLVQRSRHPSRGPVPTFSGETRLIPTKLSSFDEYADWSQSCALELNREMQIEASLIPSRSRAFSISGTCALCARKTVFRADFQYVLRAQDGTLYPNLRENLPCAHCGLKSRLRGSLHMFIQELAPSSQQQIYITEQLGASYGWLKGRGYDVTGSEYLPKSGPFGTSRRGIHNQDLGALTWSSETFDFVLSFDVLEHVPDVTRCFAEIFRSLKTGGGLLFTAPFRVDLEETEVRAVAGSDGEILHLMEPDYHGGIMTEPDKGTLAFRCFGWDTLRQLKNSGFSDAQVWLYWSRELGYLGGTQVVIVAHKK